MPTETTNEALTRLGFSARKSHVKRERDITDGKGAVVFTGDLLGVNAWMRRAMPIKLNRPYVAAGRVPYWYRLERDDNENWQVRYARSKDAVLAADSATICSKTANYRDEAEQFIRDMIAPANPNKETGQ